MKKIINNPAMYVDEMLDGLCMAHPSLVRTGESNRVIARAGGIRAGKVGIVTGGGSGQLPLFTGYVGEGLLDACAKVQGARVRRRHHRGRARGRPLRGALLYTAASRARVLLHVFES